MMRKWIILLLLVAAAAQSAAPTQSPAQDDNQAKARAILDQMIAALGGQAYLTYQDISQEGRTYSFYQGKASGAGTVFWRFWKWPDKDRFEFTKQRDVVQIFNGSDAWEITFRGTAFIPKDKADDFQRRRAHSLEHVLREWLKQPGAALFYEGPAIAENQATDKITIMTAQNDAVTIYVDSLSHLPVKNSFVYRDPQYRDRDEDSEIWGNYRNVQGITTAFTYSRTHNGDTVTQRYLTNVTYNEGLPDALFQPQHPPPGTIQK